MAAPVIPNLGDISKLPLGSIPGASFSSSLGLETNPVLSPFNSLYNAVAARRATLGLSNPGTIENLNKEVSKDVFLNSEFSADSALICQSPFP